MTEPVDPLEQAKIYRAPEPETPESGQVIDLAERRRTKDQEHGEPIVMRRRRPRRIR